MHLLRHLLGFQLLLLLLLIVQSATASSGRCISLRGVLRARHVHHGVWPLTWLRLWLLYVGRPRLRLLLLLLLLLLLTGGCLSLLARLTLLRLLLLEHLLLLEVLLLLLVRQVLLSVLRVRVVICRILHHFLVDVAQVFEHVDELHSLLLDVRLVGVPNEVHVDAAIAAGSLPALGFLTLVIEGVLLVEVVKVFVADLARHGWLIRCNLTP